VEGKLQGTILEDIKMKRNQILVKIANKEAKAKARELKEKDKAVKKKIREEIREKKRVAAEARGRKKRSKGAKRKVDQDDGIEEGEGLAIESNVSQRGRKRTTKKK
jgi:hypothetical protein